MCEKELFKPLYWFQPDLSGRCQAGEREIPAGHGRVGREDEGDGSRGSYPKKVSEKDQESHLNESQEKENG